MKSLSRTGTVPPKIFPGATKIRYADVWKILKPTSFFTRLGLERTIYNPAVISKTAVT